MKDEPIHEQSDELNATMESDPKTTAEAKSIEESEGEISPGMTDLEALKRENEELKEKYIRLYSDFENYKRRTNKERLELFKMAGQDVLKSLLPVIDDLERAEKALGAESENSAIGEGIKLVSAKFKTTLEQHGLKSYDTIGLPFDADMHEAITKIPAPQKSLKGKIVDEIEKGYCLNDKVIRFAKVIVGE